MTEAEWDACTDPTPMLEFLGDHASERKLRLFASACFRRVWQHVSNPQSREAAEIAERYADAQVGPLELARARARAWAVCGELEQTMDEMERVPDSFMVHRCAADAVANACGFDDEQPYYIRVAWTAHAAGEAVWHTVGGGRLEDASAARELEWLAQVGLVRDVFGNRFCSRVETHRFTASITALAQAIYDDSAFDRLPILADALEDSGCHNSEILAHCRGPGPLVRGCWVVDMLLGKT